LGHIHKSLRSLLIFGIRSLILTDIDAIKVTGQNAKGQDEWGACPVKEGTKTSNSAINHFLSAVTWNNLKALPVGDRTIVIEFHNLYMLPTGRKHLPRTEF
jgi:hypothetical protein